MIFSCEALRELHPEPLFPREDDKDLKGCIFSNVLWEREGSKGCIK